MEETFIQLSEKEDIKRKRLNALRQMIGTVRHEINNLLAALLGNVELLLENGRPDSLTRQRLTVIRDLSSRLRNVVKNFPKIQ